MNCYEFEQWLDDYLDRDLGPEQVVAMETHLQDCAHCQKRINDERELRAALRGLPAPETSPAFFQHALQQVIYRRRIQKSKRIGFALAAGLILSISVNALFIINGRSPVSNQSADMSTQNPVVQIAINEKRDVRLVFNAATELDAAQVTLRLPEQVRVAGYPERQQLSWATRLKQGKNLLVLPVSAQRFGHGRLVAEIEHDGNTKTFTIDLEVTGQQQSIRSLAVSRTV